MAAPWASGAQARIVGTIHGQDTVNVLHFATNTAELDTAPPSPLLTALVTAIIECVIESLLPAVTQDWRLRYVDARFVYFGGGTGHGTDPVISTAPADSIGELGPTSVSFASSLVNIRTGVNGRRGRGKIFLPPAGEAQTTNSLLDDPTMTLITAFLTCMAGKFLGTSPSTDWRMGVLSRTIAGPTNANFNAGFAVAAQLSPVNRVAVLAKRKIGHGR